MKAVTLEVTPAEAHMLAVFRAMADEYQRNWLICGEVFASKFPRHRAPALRIVAGQTAIQSIKSRAPSLRLVSGGAS